MTILILCLVWSISGLIALLPFAENLKDFFTEFVVIENNPFCKEQKLKFGTLKGFILDLMSYDKGYQNISLSADDFSAITKWQDLENLSKYSSTELVKMDHYFG